MTRTRPHLLPQPTQRVLGTVDRQWCLVFRTPGGFCTAVLLATASARGCFAETRLLAFAGQTGRFRRLRLHTLWVLIRLTPAKTRCRRRTNPRDRLQVCTVTMKQALQQLQAPLSKWDEPLEGCGRVAKILSRASTPMALRCWIASLKEVCGTKTGYGGCT